MRIKSQQLHEHRPLPNQVNFVSCIMDSCVYSFIALQFHVIVFPTTSIRIVGSDLSKNEGQKKVKVLGIEKFDGTHIRYWRMQIVDYLYGKRLIFPIRKLVKIFFPIKKEASDNADDADWNLLDQQALRVVQPTLSKSVLYNVIKERSIGDLVVAQSGIMKSRQQITSCI